MPRLMWTKVMQELYRLGNEWVYTAMPLDLQSHAEGSLIQRLAQANQVLQDAARWYEVDATGWSIVAWNQESFAVTHSITLIAQDPEGLGHNIDELAGTVYAQANVSPSPPRTDSKGSDQ